MKSKITNHATIIIGLLLLAVSLYLIKTSNDPQGIMRTLPYVCIGIGCGLFGHGMGNVISERAINSYPELKKATGYCKKMTSVMWRLQTGLREKRLI